MESKHANQNGSRQIMYLWEGMEWGLKILVSAVQSRPCPPCFSCQTSTTLRHSWSRQVRDGAIHCESPRGSTGGSRSRTSRASRCRSRPRTQLEDRRVGGPARHRIRPARRNRFARCAPGAWRCRAGGRRLWREHGNRTGFPTAAPRLSWPRTRSQSSCRFEPVSGLMSATLRSPCRSCDRRACMEQRGYTVRTTTE